MIISDIIVKMREKLLVWKNSYDCIGLKDIAPLCNVRVNSRPGEIYPYVQYDIYIVYVICNRIMCAIFQSDCIYNVQFELY